MPDLELGTDSVRALSPVPDLERKTPWGKTL
jgi:hypothetical protein